MIIFISGLSGAGKSALTEYFQANPLPDWAFYDFDKGREKWPDDPSLHLAWRTAQTQYWLEIAQDNQHKGMHIAILGLTLYPQEIKELAKPLNIPAENILTALLYCEPEERKKRLINRGTPQHWQGHKPWYDEFYAVMRQDSEREFDTTTKSVVATAEEIAEWLKTV